jgi:hypothetical protein
LIPTGKAIFTGEPQQQAEIGMHTAVYIPCRNCVEWARSVELPDGLDYIVFDNHSEDGTADAFERRGALVFRNPEDIGRVANWKRCIEHFRASGYQWMRWLFTGDSLDAESVGATRHADDAFPAASLVAGRFLNRLSDEDSNLQGGSGRWAMIPSVQALGEMAAFGNTIGPLFALAIKKSGLGAVAADFGHFQWAGDMLFYVDLLKHNDLARSPMVFGTFNAAARKTFSSMSRSSVAMVESAAARVAAAAAEFELSRSREGYESRVLGIAEDFLANLLNLDMPDSRRASLLKLFSKGIKKGELFEMGQWKLSRWMQGTADV